jgi:hypothetical protein
MKLFNLICVIIAICVALMCYRYTITIENMGMKNGNQKLPCKIRTSDGTIVEIPEPWYQDPANPMQCYAPSKQKCCNQVLQGCMQNFQNYNLNKINAWKRNCL